MTFTVAEPVCEVNEPIEGEEDEEDDEELPMVTAEVTATVKAAEKEEGNAIPKKVYLNFKRKSGEQMVFRNFLKKAMEDLEMFMLPSE